VDTWDWQERLHGLDPYFGTDKNTPIGHLVHAVFDVSPVVLFGVAVVFGLLWSIEPWIADVFARRAEARTSASRSADGSVLWKFESEINFVRLFEAFGDSGAKVVYGVVQATIVNSGAVAGIVTGFRFTVGVQSGQTSQVTCLPIVPGQAVRVPIGSSHTVTYVSEDTLLFKASAAIPAGGRITGIQYFEIDGVSSIGEVRFSTLAMHFRDASKRSWNTPAWAEHAADMAGSFPYVPGLPIPEPNG